MHQIISGNLRKESSRIRSIQVCIELRKSTAILDIAMYVRDEVITMDELEGFSEDMIDAVKLILSR